MRPHALILALLMVTPLAAHSVAAPSGADPRPQAAADFDRALAPIRSRAALDDYLAHNHAASNPFDALSPPARERFLASLRFGPAGLASLRFDDLQAELTASQAYRLLALFGLQTALAGMPQIKVVSDEDRAVDTWRAGVTLPDLFVLDAVCTGKSWGCFEVYGGICWLPCSIQ